VGELQRLFNPFALASVMITVAKAKQYVKALLLILVTELGILIDCKEVHSLNALSSMLITELGKLIDCKEVQ
jgi:hypothetical protein